MRQDGLGRAETKDAEVGLADDYTALTEKQTKHAEVLDDGLEQIQAARDVKAATETTEEADRDICYVTAAADTRRETTDDVKLWCVVRICAEIIEIYA